MTPPHLELGTVLGGYQFMHIECETANMLKWSKENKINFSFSMGHRKIVSTGEGSMKGLYLGFVNGIRLGLTVILFYLLLALDGKV